MISTSLAQFIESIDHLAMDGGRALGNDGEGRRPNTKAKIVTTVIGSVGTVCRGAGSFLTKEGNRYRCVVKGAYDTSSIALSVAATAAISAEYFHLISNRQSVRGKQTTGTSSTGTYSGCTSTGLLGIIRDSTTTNIGRRRSRSWHRRSRLQMNHRPTVQANRDAFDPQAPKDVLWSLLRGR